MGTEPLSLIPIACSHRGVCRVWTRSPGCRFQHFQRSTAVGGSGVASERSWIGHASPAGRASLVQKRAFRHSARDPKGTPPLPPPNNLARATRSTTGS